MAAVAGQVDVARLAGIEFAAENGAAVAIAEIGGYGLAAHAITVRRQGKPFHRAAEPDGLDVAVVMTAYMHFPDPAPGGHRRYCHRTAKRGSQKSNSVCPHSVISTNFERRASAWRNNFAG
jgi:hypothetical protein